MDQIATITTAAQDRTLVITRLFDAPRSLVFRAWTDPAHLLRWMGPRNYPACHVEQDSRPGGAWRFCMRPLHGGPDLWNGGVLREIVEPERLVFTFAWHDDAGYPKHETLVTITLAEQHGKTLMTLHQAAFESVEQRDSHGGGWNSSFDRLAEHLAATGCSEL